MGKRAILITLVLLISGALALTSATAQTACTPADPLGAAAAAEANGEYGRAAAEYTCALQADPANLQLIVARMEAALYAGQFTRAIADANFLSDNAPDIFDAAQQAAIQEANFNTQDIAALTLRAFLYWSTAQDDLARPDYDLIVRLDPDNAFGYLFRGSSAQYLGDVLLAGDDFRDAASAAPNNPDVFSVIGSTYAQTGEFDRALEYLNSALRLDASHARAYYFIGYILLERNQVDAAIENFNQALALDPSAADPYYDRGLAYGRQENYPAALADFDQALTINPNFREAVVARARIYDLLGDDARAIGDYNTYVELNLLRLVNGEPLFPGLPLTLNMEDGIVYRLPMNAAAGEVISITAVSPNNLADPLLVLLDADGNPVAANDDVAIGDFTAQIVNFTAPATGSYLVILTHSDGGYRGRVDVTLEVG